MMKRQKSGTVRDQTGERVVLIAVKASREIPKSAFIWALTHVVQPGDCAKLLVVIPAHTSSNPLNPIFMLHLFLLQSRAHNFSLIFQNCQFDFLGF